MEPKLFKALARKMDEFIQETADEDINFFFGNKTPAIMAEAAAAVFDGMQYELYQAEDCKAVGNADRYNPPQMIPV